LTAVSSPNEQAGHGLMAGWLETNRGVVFPWHCDQFGHMNVRWYAHFFDDAGFAVWPMLGLGYDLMQEHGFHTVIGRTTTNFVRELTAGTLVVVRSALIRVGGKSVTVRHRLEGAETGELHATQEMVEVFFDPQTRTAIPIPDSFRTVLEENLVADDDAEI
jgi:acyl-CoA thioester hydrolase